MYFTIHKATDGSAQPYWWTGYGDNNEPVCHSERLSSKQTALNTINMIKREAASAKVYNDTGEPM